MSGDDDWSKTMRLSRISKKNNMRILKIAIGGAVLVGLGAGKVLLKLKPKTLKPVESLELHRFAGKWYEIARKPVTIERRSFQNITTHYTVIDENKLEVEWHYNTDDGKLGQLFGEAVVVNPPDNSRFKISYLPEFLHALRARSYIIFRLDPDYKIMLLGNKKRTHLWLLARDPNLDSRVVEDYLSVACEQGFKLDNLIYVEHHKVAAKQTNSLKA